MFKRLFKLSHTIRNLGNPVEYNLEPYLKVLGEINRIQLDTISDRRLKEMFLSHTQKKLRV